MLALALAITVSCADSVNSNDVAANDAVTLVVYDSWPPEGSEQPSGLEQALSEFTATTGIEVEVLVSGDAGTMLSKAALTSGNPEGDVMWGVDNTLLSRAIDQRVFEPYIANDLDSVPQEFRTLVPEGEATPVDYGDVCVNFDVAALRAAGLDPPSSLADLAQPEYAGQLVVPNPATSTPGLAFLLATVATLGDGASGWESFWAELRRNGVLVVDSWTDAYWDAFSWSGGNRALVVSYGSSPPVEVLFADPPLESAPTGVVESTCFRQVEFAGILRGTDQIEAARLLIDFLISHRFQQEVALNLFVYPVRADVNLDATFVQYAIIPDNPVEMNPRIIEENRSEWIDRWTDIVLG